jgi:mono/diheme cytochrome c family protein
MPASRPKKLFADGCATCHRSPRGLAKGRFSLTLSWFLKDHYATSSDSAKSLAAYLVSVDAPPPRAAAKPGAKSSRSAPRPAKAGDKPVVSATRALFAPIGLRDQPPCTARSSAFMRVCPVVT